MKEKSNEALCILIEECSEVSQAITKIFRFGWDSCHPTVSPNKTNKQHLIEELGDVLALIDIVKELYTLSEDDIIQAKLNKIEKLKKWSTLFK
jgi:NTP pyrophosphatase (non-canonical NTP hydrolase)